MLTSHAEQELPDEEEIDGVVVRLPMRAAIARGDLPAIAGVLREVSELKRSFAPGSRARPRRRAEPLLPAQDASQRTPWLLGLQQQLLGSQEGGASSLLRDGLRSASWVVGCRELVTEQAHRLAPELRGSLLHDLQQRRDDRSGGGAWRHHRRSLSSRSSAGSCRPRAWTSCWRLSPVCACGSRLSAWSLSATVPSVRRWSACQRSSVWKRW